MDTVKFTVIGSSLAGANIVQELIRALEANTKYNYHMTVIDPRTAYECFPISWNNLDKDMWSIPTPIATAADKNNTDQHKRVTATIHNSPALTPAFVAFDETLLKTHPNITFIHAIVTEIDEENHKVKFTIPDYLAPLNDHLPTELLAQQEVEHTILYNCSGSTSTAPIKSFEHILRNDVNLNNILAPPSAEEGGVSVAAGEGTLSEDVVQQQQQKLVDILIHLFFSADLDQLSHLALDTHLVMQSLLYLPKTHVDYLVLYYFPQALANDTFMYAFDEKTAAPNAQDKVMYNTYRVLSLLCYTLRLTPTALITTFFNVLSNHAVGLSAPALTHLQQAATSTTLPTPKHDTLSLRFIEMSAMRCMLLHTAQTAAPWWWPQTVSNLTTPILPPIHTFNFVGGGPTAVELCGIFADTLYNHAQQVNQLPATPSPTRPTFIVHAASTILPTASTPALRDTVKQWFQCEAYQKVVDIKFNEGAMWSAKDLGEQRIALFPQEEDKAAATAEEQIATKNKKWGLITMLAWGVKQLPMSQTPTTPALITKTSFQKLEEQVKAFERDGATPTQLPPLTFVLGDATCATNKHIPPTSFASRVGTETAARNTMLYLQNIAEPFFQSQQGEGTAAPSSSSSSSVFREWISFGKIDTTYSKASHVHRNKLFISKVEPLGDLPPLTMYSFGQWNSAIVYGTSYHLTRFVPFGWAVCPVLKGTICAWIVNGLKKSKRE